MTLNAQLLGGRLSFFQSLCVLGYCLLPTAAAALVTRVIVAVAEPSLLLFCLRLGITAVGFVWATYGTHFIYGWRG